MSKAEGEEETPSNQSRGSASYRRGGNRARGLCEEDKVVSCDQLKKTLKF